MKHFEKIKVEALRLLASDRALRAGAAPRAFESAAAPPRAKCGARTLNRVFKPYKSKALDRAALGRGAEWADFGLRFNGATNLRNCGACPVAADVVGGHAEAHTAVHGSAYFSLLAPKTHIKRHCGPTNTRLRLHLGLVVPDGCRIRVGDETRTWAEGECLLFDDSFEHEVWNDNHTEERLVLIVDVWHPDLATDEARLARLDPAQHAAYRHLAKHDFLRDTTDSGH